MRIVLNNGNSTPRVEPTPIQTVQQIDDLHTEAIIPESREVTVVTEEDTPLERIIPESVDVKWIRELTDEFVSDLQKQPQELDMDPKLNGMTKTDYYQFIANWTITNLRKKATMLNIRWQKHWKKRDFIIYIVNKVYGEREEQSSS